MVIQVECKIRSAIFQAKRTSFKFYLKSVNNCFSLNLVAPAFFDDGSSRRFSYNAEIFRGKIAREEDTFSYCFWLGTFVVSMGYEVEAISALEEERNMTVFKT